jgi:hypothetical protein
MGMVQRAELDMIGFDVGNDPAKQGRIALRWRKLTYVDDVLKATDYHRTFIDADTDVHGTLELIGDDLEREGFARPPATDVPYIDAVTSLAWTDRKQKREAAEAEAAREAEALAAEAKARQDQFDAAVAAAVARLGKNKP